MECLCTKKYIVCTDEKVHKKVGSGEIKWGAPQKQKRGEWGDKVGHPPLR